KKHVRRLAIIFGVLLLSFYVFYMFLLDTTFRREANEMAHYNHQLKSNTFEHLLETLYEAYQEDHLTWDTKSYTTELNQTIPFNKYTISKLSTLFSDETDDQVVLAIKKADQNEVAYKLMSQVLLDQGLTMNQ